MYAINQKAIFSKLKSNPFIANIPATSQMK